jgi:hypothetical protein
VTVRRNVTDTTILDSIASLRFADRLVRELNEVSEATGTTATLVLDGLERSLDLVEQLESIESDVETASLLGRLRGELVRAMDGLRFQDDAARHLKSVSTRLGQLDARPGSLLQLQVRPDTDSSVD